MLCDGGAEMFGSKESKEEKQIRKERELLASYGLQDISPEYSDAVRKAISGLAGCSMIQLGTVFSGSAQDVAKMTLLRAIVEQNFIIIRELDKLTKE